jgi:hypothetical protein
MLFHDGLYRVETVGMAYTPYNAMSSVNALGPQYLERPGAVLIKAGHNVIPMSCLVSLCRNIHILLMLIIHHIAK